MLVEKRALRRAPESFESMDEISIDPEDQELSESLSPTLTRSDRIRPSPSVPSSQSQRPIPRRHRFESAPSEIEERFLTSFNRLVDGALSQSRGTPSVPPTDEAALERIVEKAVGKAVGEAVGEAVGDLQSQISQLISFLKDRKEKDGVDT